MPDPILILAAWAGRVAGLVYDWTTLAIVATALAAGWRRRSIAWPLAVALTVAAAVVAINPLASLMHATTPRMLLAAALWCAARLVRAVFR